MIKDTILLSTKLDQKDLSKMESQLSSRFVKITKKFGKGMIGAFKGGGLIGAGLGLIDKLLNPLQAVQESIDKTLGIASDTVAQSEAFGTTAGRLMKLQTFARAKGLDDQALYQLLGKYQSAVVKARENPTEKSAVGQFVGYKDMAEGFFAFVQSMQSLDRTQQISAQEAVFGQKQVLRAADFLQTNFGDLSKQFGKLDTKRMTGGLQRLDTVGDYNDVLVGKRSWDDIINKAPLINKGMMRAKDSADRAALKRENQQISNYENLIALTKTTNEIMGLLEKGVGVLGGFIKFVTPKITGLVTSIEKLSTASIFRGIFKSRGKGD